MREGLLTSGNPVGNSRFSDQEKFSPRALVLLARRGRSAYTPPCPISHVPVVACWSADLRTRGRKNASRWGKALGRTLKNGPAAGGENRRPRPKRVTQLKATTERAFLVSAGFQVRRTKEACPSCRACGRGFPFQTMASPNGFRFASRSGTWTSRHTAQRHRRNVSSPGPARHGMSIEAVPRLHRANG